MVLRMRSYKEGILLFRRWQAGGTVSADGHRQRVCLPCAECGRLDELARDQIVSPRGSEYDSELSDDNVRSGVVLPCSGVACYEVVDVAPHRLLSRIRADLCQSVFCEHIHEGDVIDCRGRASRSADDLERIHLSGCYLKCVSDGAPERVVDVALRIVSVIDGFRRP